MKRADITRVTLLERSQSENSPRFCRLPANRQDYKERTARLRQHHAGIGRRQVYPRAGYGLEARHEPAENYCGGFRHMSRQLGGVRLV